MKQTTARFWKRLEPVILMVGLFANCIEAQPPQKRHPQEQTGFSAEADTVIRPAKLPEDVLRILAKDGCNLLAMKGAPPGQLPPAEWFLASEIHLAGPDEVDLVVMGAGKLRWSTECFFWVFQKTADGYNLVLRTPLHNLGVMDSRSAGYRDIEAWSTAHGTLNMLEFKFDGDQYQVAHRIESPSHQKAGQQEQTVFSAEDDTLDRPTKLPESVLRILGNDRHVILGMKGGPPGQLPPAEWFAASEIHLAGPGEADLIVMGVDELRGASVCTFWIFQKTTDGYNLVLRTAVHDLEVLDSKTAGYRDIQTSSSTAVTHTGLVFKFDGHQYQEVEKKTEP